MLGIHPLSLVAAVIRIELVAGLVPDRDDAKHSMRIF